MSKSIIGPHRPMPRSPAQERDELRLELAARIDATDKLFEDLQIVASRLEGGLREAFEKFAEATHKETQARWERQKKLA